MSYRTHSGKEKYSDSDLREELKRFGFNPGPIVDSTRSFYIKKLATLKGNYKYDYSSSSSSDSEPVYKRVKPKKQQPKKYKASKFNIQDCLRSADWRQDLKPYLKLEKEAREYFEDPRNNTTNDTTKKSFTYLLLDPTMTKNLPAKTKTLNINKQWTTFIDSIFYVGKGKNDRPYKHLIEAIPLWEKYKTSKDEKIQRILDIWEDDKGVICLHVFHNVTQDEAFTYEAAMIDALGIDTLTNIKLGSYKGVVESWSEDEQQMLGIYLLYKAMNNYLNEGERQLRPNDI